MMTSHRPGDVEAFQSIADYFGSFAAKGLVAGFSSEVP